MVTAVNTRKQSSECQIERESCAGTWLKLPSANLAFCYFLPCVSTPSCSGAHDAAQVHLSSSGLSTFWPIQHTLSVCMLSHLSADDIAQPAAQLWGVTRCSALLQQGLLAEPQAVYRCSHIPACQGAQRLLLQKACLVACACAHTPETVGRIAAARNSGGPLLQPHPRLPGNTAPAAPES